MKRIGIVVLMAGVLFSCQERIGKGVPVFTNFSEVSDIDISQGGEGAAEISAYDPMTQRLFVVNNELDSKVNVIDFSDIKNLMDLPGESIDVTPYGGGVNSVAVKNGLLAMAVEANTKTDNGSIVIFETTNLITPIQVIPVGALPDMVTFSPNGQFIVSANEGEPNDDYSVDPEGSISIIDVTDGFSYQTLGFGAFESQKEALMDQGYRVFGPEATLAMDTEPEYVAISANSTTAWVTLQENNGIAKVDLLGKQITEILPLGMKDYSKKANVLDPSDKDDAIELGNWPLKTYFMPDAIVAYSVGNTDFLITANEGDAREYDGFEEESRVEDLMLDETAFPNWEELQKKGNLGRYTATTISGDLDGDGDFDEIHGFGGRSFTIWNANGAMVNDYKTLEMDLINTNSSLYDDGRSDNKGVEPEAVEIGTSGGRTYLFVGMERADAVGVYELRGVGSIEFIQLLKVGDAPEGVLFIPEEESPNGRATLVVSSEDDGVIKVFQN
ncbi:choice-of-anchor I family protein [Algoriphagus zhangzhouensis]|uniref:Choice-of-anchor I domain-containing protein n=1 Tax=Algoriphagus zhangzhouensis TaxID=1073327 RepID=A0A1M7ZB30_9BACT|nr:choice-of-anchor I family protein [Algoriphagus zhangzhouensis]TDY46999.1 hypothetical protein A8938_1451 [Algoriphagus zhangzhouensis]SHO62042.1 hypothetical protein SAMN04488108_1811 [Algoriphagus zhangzhouensis]